MTLEKYAKLFKKYVGRTFNSNQDAADYFGCSPGMVSNVKVARKHPTESMLKATGHIRDHVIRYVKVK